MSSLSNVKRVLLPMLGPVFPERGLVGMPSLYRPRRPQYSSNASSRFNGHHANIGKRTYRESNLIMPTECSATGSVLGSGAFTTRMRRAVVDSASMLSAPVPWRPTTLSRGAASITMATTCPCVRTTPMPTLARVGQFVNARAAWARFQSLLSEPPAGLLARRMLAWSNLREVGEVSPKQDETASSLHRLDRESQ